MIIANYGILESVNHSIDKSSRGYWRDRMKAPENKDSTPSFGSVPADSWIVSLRRNLSQLAEERKNPPAKLELSVKGDPSALDNLVDMPSPFISLIEQVRTGIDDILHPKEKFEASAEPVELEEVWSAHSLTTPGAISMAAHVLVVVLMLVPFFGSGRDGLQVTETFIPLVAPPLILNLPEEDDQAGGGGGGGQLEETPPSLGELPEPDDQQLVPPTPEILNFDPILVAAPTVVAPQLVDPDETFDLAMLGDFQGIPGPPSAGPGVGGGIGTGQGRGVGEGSGPGVGEGEGGGFGGGVFSVGGGVTIPTLLSQILPEYSEEARKAKYQGTVILETIVRRDGTVEVVRVSRSLGFGLDDKAIEAVTKWRFRPGMRNGEAVDVALKIEVNFNLR